jgi:metal-responsive CopG/Arc/MetJ family transcriptional regulator
MKTIAITIEEDILDRIDRWAAQQHPTTKNRSKVIRMAIREYVTRVEQLSEDEREAAIIRKHKGELARQAQALVKEQAKP